MRILVVGATGLVGRQVVQRVRLGGHEARAMMRGGTAHSKALEWCDSRVEIVDGDLARPETLDAACRGVETVAVTATSMPYALNDGIRRVDHEGTLALIAAAEQANVRNFVYVSHSANVRHDSPFANAKRACETRLRRGSMHTVIVRPCYFMEVWLAARLGFDPLRRTVRIYGGGESKVSYVSASDVAKFAAFAATTPPSTKHTILEVGGPGALSQLDAVDVFERALGTKMDLRFVTVDALNAQYRAADPVQKSLAALTLDYAGGDVIAGAEEVARRCGINLRSVTQFATETVGRFR